MTRGMSCSDQHFAKSETITVFYFLDFEFVLGSAFVTGKDFRRFQACTEFARAAHQISVNMRFENVCDRDACFSRHLNVNIAVRPRIENRRDSFVIVANKVGKLGDPCGLDGFEDE